MMGNELKPSDLVPLFIALVVAVLLGIPIGLMMCSC